MKKGIWQQFLDFGKGWGIAVAVFTVLVGLGVKYETRLFSSGEVKYETEKYMKDKPSTEQLHRDRILDSINNVEAIKSRRMRDSLMREEARQRAKNDSFYKEELLKINDQVYQIKEELKSE